LAVRGAAARVAEAGDRGTRDRRAGAGRTRLRPRLSQRQSAGPGSTTGPGADVSHGLRACETILRQVTADTAGQPPVAARYLRSANVTRLLVQHAQAVDQPADQVALLERGDHVHHREL